MTLLYDRRFQIHGFKVSNLVDSFLLDQGRGFSAALCQGIAHLSVLFRELGTTREVVMWTGIIAVPVV